MKYFKFTKIDAETGISWAIAQPISGPSWPDLPGLDLNTVIHVSENSFYYVGLVEDNVTANPENHFFDITKEEYADIVYNQTMNNINFLKANIYRLEKEYRDAKFSQYHETATIAGIYKYEQAKALLADPNYSAPEVQLEAQLRGVSVTEMANRIITNHESFRQKEAKISGIRGMMLDRLNNFVFDFENPYNSFLEYNSEEVIGTEFNEDGEEVEVKLPKYILNLRARLRFA